MLYQLPAIPLERGKQYPNPLIVPHTLGDIKIGGYPQTSSRRKLSCTSFYSYPSLTRGKD